MNNENPTQPYFPSRVQKFGLFFSGKFCQYCGSTMSRKYIYFGKAICDSDECFGRYETNNFPIFKHIPPPPPPKHKTNYEFYMFEASTAMSKLGIALMQNEGWQIATECKPKQIDEGQRTIILMKRGIK